MVTAEKTINAHYILRKGILWSYGLPLTLLHTKGWGTLPADVTYSQTPVQIRINMRNNFNKYV